MVVNIEKGKIGVFDSGLGGLWILKHMRDVMPLYDYVFYGDQKNMPYGVKSKEELVEFTQNALSFLYEKEKCTAVLLACNTTSTNIYKELKKWVEVKYPGKFLFSISSPTVDVVTEAEPVAVFATHRTVESHFYKDMLESKGILTYEFVLVELASLIERGGDVREYLDKHRYIIQAGIHTVILGCTHYGIVIDIFKETFPNISRWIRQEEVIPFFFEKYIQENPDFKNMLSDGGSVSFFSTEQNEVFEKYLEDWYGQSVSIKYI
jgi:glutamate racemase